MPGKLDEERDLGVGDEDEEEEDEDEDEKEDDGEGGFGWRRWWRKKEVGGFKNICRGKLDEETK